MTLPATAPHTAARDSFFKLALAIGVLVVGLEVGYLLYSPLPYDPVGYLVAATLLTRGWEVNLR